MFSIILAGGSGSRLWPLSRELYPKQLLNIQNKESLLQEKSNLEEKLTENNNIKFSLYKDKINNVISEKDYIEFSNKLSNDILSLENRIKYINDEFQKISANHNNKKVILQLVNKFLNTETISRNDILQLVDKIKIGAHIEHLKIYFKFSI